jgi:hypothetical protein
MGPGGRVRTKDLIIYLSIFVFFGGLYFFWGTAIGEAGGYSYLNAALSADHERVIGDLTTVNTYHGRTAVHPLFVLLLNPLGVLLTRVVGSAQAAAIAMNAAAGATCVLLTYAFLRKTGSSGYYAFAFAATLGFSATHLFFGSTPETWAFAALGVILLFALVPVAPGRTAAFLPAGVFAAGMLTPNLVPAALAFASGLYKRVRFKALIGKTLLFVLLVIACTVALSIVQKALYPRSALFFLPDAWLGELGSYSPVVKSSGYLGLDYVGARLASLGGVFFIFNVVAPEVVVSWHSAGPVCLPLKPFVNAAFPRLEPLGIVAAVIWVGLIIWAAYSFIKHKETRTAVSIGLLLTPAFNVIFYFFYGTTLYVYAISTAFPLVASMALALRPYDRPGTKGFYALAAILYGFLIVEIINNLRFLYQILQVFRGYPFPLTP